MSMLTDMDTAGAAFVMLPATVDLDVSSADIGTGVRGASIACPLALAAQRQLGPLFPPRTIIRAFNGSVHIMTGNHSCRFWIGDPGMKFMARFDAGKRVKPGTYEIHKPGTGPGPWLGTR